MESHQTQVYIFGGKGGVGKTTSAAATGVYFSEKGKKTLVLSSDPTPSLSDIFQVNLDHSPQKIPSTKNLSGLEISHDEIKEQWKTKFGPEIHDAITSIVPVDFDIVDYVAGAPGIDEEFLLDYIHSLIDTNEYEVVIWDTAPAGHTLRLLQLPQEFLNHLSSAKKLYFKVKSYLAKLRGDSENRSLPSIIEAWSDLSSSVTRLLTNKQRTKFSIVTQPETLVVQQTQRIYQELKSFGIHPQCIIINSIIPETSDAFHGSRRKIQQTQIRELESYFASEPVQITKIPLLLHNVSGIEMLHEIINYLDF
ncbi:MAG: ArsA family ATPase [Candidatus Ranarchaeia archaeon]|jgi:arsenite-transporting ATPase